MEIKKFLERYRPQRLTKPDKAFLEKYKHIAPEFLIEFWQNYGFGKFGDGIIEFIRPNDYNALFWKWMGEKKENYIPIAISAFGDIFYSNWLKRALCNSNNCYLCEFWACFRKLF